MLTVDGGGGGGQVLELDRDKLTKIVKALTETAGELEASRAALASVKAASFGGSWMGSFVAQHSDKAFQAVSEALADNAVALQHYETALSQVEKDTEVVEDTTKQDLTVQTQRLEQEIGQGNDCTAAGAGDQTVTCRP